MALLRSDIINKDFIEQVLKKKEVTFDKVQFLQKGRKNLELSST